MARALSPHDAVPGGEWQQRQQDGQEQESHRSRRAIAAGPSYCLDQKRRPADSPDPVRWNNGAGHKPMIGADVCMQAG